MDCGGRSTTDNKDQLQIGLVHNLDLNLELTRMKFDTFGTKFMEINRRNSEKLGPVPNINSEKP